MALEWLCKCRSVAVSGAPAPPTARASRHSQFDPQRQQPILEIHSGGIRVPERARVSIQVTEKRGLVLTCTCGWKLAVHASKRGAFCQFEKPPPHAACGSLPEAPFLAGFHRVPGSLRRLFAPESDSELFGTHDEMDSMFGRRVDPLVGSFSGVDGGLLGLPGADCPPARDGPKVRGTPCAPSIPDEGDDQNSHNK
jgi:hypothetical protein